jgi:hypothetical protein
MGFQETFIKSQAKLITRSIATNSYKRVVERLQMIVTDLPNIASREGGVALFDAQSEGKLLKKKPVPS